MVSLRADVDAILDVWVPEPKATPAELAKDMVLSTLFKTITAPLLPPHERDKRHQPRESDETRAKKERTKLEAARRALL